MTPGKRPFDEAFELTLLLLGRDAGLQSTDHRFSEARMARLGHHCGDLLRLQRFEQGFLLRGLDIEVTLDSNGFTGEGDIHLFGEMLNRFFALYADMNLFNQLTLIVQPEGKCIRWKENHSPRLPG